VSNIHAGRVPKYYTVKTRLESMMARLGEGAPLPPERELAADFGVARSTVRQAISELTMAGRLRAHQGRGTFVASPKMIQPLSLASYTERLRDMGRVPGRAVVTFERVAADADLAGQLSVGVGDEVVFLERVLLADGEPIGLESSYLPYARYPALMGELDPTGSLYAFMQARYGVVYAEAIERIETVLAGPREAALLSANPATPMLLLLRTSTDPYGVRIEWVRTIYRGDRIGFEARLHAG
jgi:GntR family transcriptional regulator